MTNHNPAPPASLGRPIFRETPVPAGPRAGPAQPGAEAARPFPLGAGILLGLGLGGLFDGIVLHQVLQWHHMVTSAGPSADTIEGLEVNTFFDGLFHVLAYGLVAAGLGLLWRAARQPHRLWSTRRLLGSMLIGWGVFNLVEGVVNHHLLGLHHVNETVPAAQWIYWDMGFLAWGAAMLAGGWMLVRDRGEPG
jgi:uncharacterized membrane protein